MTRETVDVRTFILSCLQEPLSAVGMRNRPVPEHFDLRASGVIDSLGFLQLLGHLEARFQRPIDLSQLPAEQLTDLGALSRHIAAQIARAVAPRDAVAAADPAHT